MANQNEEKQEVQEMSKPYEKETYFGLTLDPVHIGTGGYRLGRVDNTITREPGTNLPKIPGTGISGVARAFTAMAIQNENQTAPEKPTTDGWVIDYDKYKRWKYQRPLYDFVIEDGKIKINSERKAMIKPNLDGPVIKKDSEGKDIYDSCAGKGGEKGESHCGEPDCEVCVIYGFSREKSSFQGMAQFFDARILFFPVYSMVGPVWITSEGIMGEFGLTDAILTNKEKFRRFNTSLPSRLNLGWLMLEGEDGPITLELKFPDVPQKIKDQLVLVSDKLFSRIVNDNLEVRTSVAIDPATGAAEDGALYTYEAIPRATVLWFDVIFNDPKNFKINGQKIMKTLTEEADCTWIKNNVEKGLKLIEYMGVGGMNTRGMGRMRILNLGR